MNIKVDWNHIDAVFFDMDGTLLDLHYDNYFWLNHLPKRLNQLTHHSQDKVDRLLNKMFDDLKGTLKWYCLDHWAKALDIDLLALKHEVSAKISYRPGAIELIDAIDAKGIEMMIVTNAHPSCVSLKAQYVDLIERIPLVTTSHDFGYAKEHPLFWTRFCEAKPFDPDRVIFIDDNEEVLEAANAFGINHVYSIKQPDSQRSREDHSRFYRIDSFEELDAH